MPSEIAKQDATLFHLADDISAYWESREMVAAQLSAGVPDEEKPALVAQLAEIDDRLGSLGAELATKTDNIAGVLRRMSVEQEQLESEQERIRQRRKTMERAEEWLRKYVLSVMQQRGLKQLKTPANTLFIRQSDAAIVTEPETLPEAYKNVTVKMPAWIWRVLCERSQADIPDIAAIRVAEDISLSAIKKAIKSGVTVEGADLEFHESLVLR
jgi:hypothetical protein